MSEREQINAADASAQHIRQIQFSAANKSRETVSEQIKPGIYNETPLSTLIKLADLATVLTDKVKLEQPPDFNIHCRAGCSYCCHMRVLVTPFEVIALADYIRHSFSENQIQELKKRISKADSITHGLPDEEHGNAGVWCPLLVEDKCSVYEARPLECRGYVSMDVNECKKTFKNYLEWNVPIYFPQYSIYKNIQAGLISALQNDGYQFELLELISALKVALDHNDIAQRWIAGEHIFKSASLSEYDPEYYAIQPWTPTFGENIG